MTARLAGFDMYRANFNIAAQQQTEVSENQGLKVKQGARSNFLSAKSNIGGFSNDYHNYRHYHHALAIEVDKLTQYRHYGLPLVALGAY